MATKDKVCLSIVMVAVICIVTVLGIVVEPSRFTRHTFAQIGYSQFPALFLETNGRPISRTNWSNARISVRNTTDNPFDFQDIEIRGRGNSTWFAEKKPFRIRFPHEIEMLDSGFAAQNWTLIACHFDHSLIRQYAAYTFASKLDGMNYSPYARFVDLFMNNVFMGVYMLSVHVPETGESMANLTAHGDPSKSDYLIQMDWRSGNLTVNDRNWYRIEFPNNPNTAHEKYVIDFLTKAENAMVSRDWDAIQSIIDVDSFIDFFIVQEWFKNMDVCSLSIYMQILTDGNNDRRLHMGPVWDFDRSAGNSTLHGYAGMSPQGPHMASRNRWFTNLLNVPEFRELTNQRWQYVRDNAAADLITHIEQKVDYYKQSFERNFLAWDILGRNLRSHPRPVASIRTFTGHVNQVLDFLQTRKYWLTYFLGQTH